MRCAFWGPTRPRPWPEPGPPGRVIQTSNARYTRAANAMPALVSPGPSRSAPPSEHQRRGRERGRVLVLNATYEPINVCSVRRAVVLMLKDKAEIIEHAEWELRSEHTAISRPVVIRLVSYVKVPREAHRRKITRRAVFARDGWTCQYCGSNSNLTVDHVIRGRTSSPPAHRATAARGTASHATPTCIPGALPGCRGQRSSSPCRARRSRPPGASTCQRPRRRRAPPSRPEKDEGRSRRGALRPQ